MTSKERVLQAIQHESTDRTPADYDAHEGVTEALIRKTGVADKEELLVSLGVDLRYTHFNPWQPPAGPDADGYMTDMYGARHRKTDPGDGLPKFISPFNEDTTLDDVHAHPWPDPDKANLSMVRENIGKVRKDVALVGVPWNPFFHEVGWLIGQEDFMVWMHTKPEVVHAIIQHVVDYEVEVTRRFLEASEGQLDIVYFGNDFGTQRGLFISPEMWHTFIRGPLKRYYDVAHGYGRKVMQHSCGSIRDIIPALIENGVDIIDPIQVAAEGMEFAGLVRDFGADVCFHGGIDTQHTLPFGSVADVRAAVMSYLELTRGGGYILGGSQNYIEDIPLDNILAVYDENLTHRSRTTS